MERSGNVTCAAKSEEEVSAVSLVFSASMFGIRADAKEQDVWSLYYPQSLWFPLPLEGSPKGSWGLDEDMIRVLWRIHRDYETNDVDARDYLS